MTGFVDLHLHGAFGIDLTTADRGQLDLLSRHLAREGYAAFLPTLVPLPHDALLAAIERLAAWIDAPPTGGAAPLGIHFEGPFVAPDRAGALHPDVFLDGTRSDDVRRFFAAIDGLPGRHMVTLAPEIPGGLDLIAEFRRRRMLVSIGHTSAGLTTLEQAVEAGAAHMTHFCNAMRPLHHRDPGPIGFGLTCPDVTLDLIADLHHLHPRTIELILTARGAERIALISDAMPAAGLDEGDYEVWGETLHVREGQARNDSGSLAGSVALLRDCVRNVTNEELMSRGDAHRSASSIPLEILRRATAPVSST